MPKLKQRNTLIFFLPLESKAPDANTAEISLFGPGIGECIVLHFGQGRWFIIDSCLCPETKQPIALQYLQSIGVDVGKQVVGILISHWHSDHIIGASLLLRTCKSAKLYLSSALMSREALHVASLYKKDTFGTGKDIREFSEIIKFLKETGDKDRLVPVKSRHTFFDDRNTIPIPARLVALSPSDVAFTQAISQLAQLNPKDGDARVRNIVPADENLNAVVIHFSFGCFSAVLGSDLEETGNLQTGWSAVFKNNIISELNLSPSSLFKVSHHGSNTGHHEKIWQDLLVKKPLSITTTFTRSGLPTPDNIKRLQELSSDFLITRDPQVKNLIKRDNMVERELRGMVKERKSINDKMGHIQIRISDKGLFNVAANQNAVRFSGSNN